MGHVVEGMQKRGGKDHIQVSDLDNEVVSEATDLEGQIQVEEKL